MTTKSTVLLVFGVLFLGMFVFIVGTGVFAFFVSPMMSGKRQVELNRKRSAETSGTITSVSQYRKASSGKGGYVSITSTYVYQYEVNGVNYDKEQQEPGRDDDKKQGTKVKICYDPSDPKSSEFYSLKADKVCGLVGAEK